MQAAVKVRGDTVESWTFENGVAIECPCKVMEEIRSAACDGLHRLVHDGLEVGGVLFGERGDHSIRLVTWRSIFCEHAFGPSFRLSQFDYSELAHSLDVAQSDPELKGLDEVGWFVSHTRGGVFLAATDVEIYNKLFPQPWQVTLVLQPTEAGSARAGFFVREEDGSLRSESSDQEFVIERPNFLLEEPQDQPSVPPLPRASIQGDTASAAAKSDIAKVAERKKISSRRFSYRGRWFLAAIMLLALLVAGLLLREKFWSSGDQSFQFRAYYAGDSVRIEWDSNSPVIRSARLAALDIKDGNEKKRLALSDEQLLAGYITYAPTSDDLAVQMVVFTRKHAAIQQFARLVGLLSASSKKLHDTQPISPPSTAVVSLRPADRDTLDGQIQQLKQELAKQTSRADQLQEVVRILKNRIAVDEGRDSASVSKLGR